MPEQPAARFIATTPPLASAARFRHCISLHHLHRRCGAPIFASRFISAGCRRCHYATTMSDFRLCDISMRRYRSKIVTMLTLPPHHQTFFRYCLSLIIISLRPSKNSIFACFSFASYMMMILDGCLIFHRGFYAAEEGRYAGRDDALAPGYRFAGQVFAGNIGIFCFGYISDDADRP
jgi:hypothetical protein